MKKKSINYDWEKRYEEAKNVGELPRALAVTMEVLTRSTTEESREYALALQKQAWIFYLMGKMEKFLEVIRSSLTLAQLHEHTDVEANCFSCLGIYNQATVHNLQVARDFYQRALELRQKIGGQQEIDSLLITIATLAKELGQFDDAKLKLFTVVNRTQDERLRICCNLEIGRIFFAEGDLEIAEGFINTALELCEENFPSERGDCLRQMARIHMKKAQQYYEQALKVYTRHDYGEKAKNLRKEMGKKERGVTVGGSVTI